MSQLIERTLRKLSVQLAGRLSRPSDSRYAAATAIWAKPIGGLPRAVAHCRTAHDVQSAIRAARDCGLPLSVRGGGHDWAGRALCEGIVIDLGRMRGVVVDRDYCAARISGGARAADVTAVADPLGLAAVTGTCGGVGMAGLALGGGYGPLIGRFGLALDNLVATEVVLSDGRIVTAAPDSEDELFFALRGGGGNFGVVTAMRYRLHRLPSVRSGLLFYPFCEAKAVLQRCTEISVSAPDELTVQVGFVPGSDGAPVVFIAPTWCGLPEAGEEWVAPFLKLGTLIAGKMQATRFGPTLTAFDAHIVNGLRVFMETCSLPSLEGSSIDALIQAMHSAASAGCMIATHEFRGAASRVAVNATAFGLRRDHVLIEIIASFADRSHPLEKQRHHEWARGTRRALDASALPDGYPNMLGRGETRRASQSYGRNAERLLEAKRHYDPDNVFSSAIPLPASAEGAGVIDSSGIAA
jgi:FAD/FMN-containing dehydrogenase